MSAADGTGKDDDPGGVFAPVRTANAFEQTVERLGRAIRMGLLAPGERLPSERDLAERLALSRSTVREALRVLQEAGYLEARRGRGGGINQGTGSTSSFCCGAPSSSSVSQSSLF